MSLEVKVKNNNVEKAIRQLKKKVMKDGLLKERKRRQFYEKPSVVEIGVGEDYCIPPTFRREHQFMVYLLPTTN